MLSKSPSEILKAIWIILRTSYILRGVQRGSKVRVMGSLSIYGRDSLTIGAGTCFHRGRNESEITVHAGGRLHIGRGCSINSTCIINASAAITIGDRCQIGYGVTILDSSLHREHPSERHLRPEPKPVFIGDDVWIGSRALILAGVTIGPGSIIGAGSVVTKDVPPMTIVAGNPARALRPVADTAIQKLSLARDEALA